jgi:hypothetical protein
MVFSRIAGRDNGLPPDSWRPVEAALTTVAINVGRFVQQYYLE